jgi:hypothetical protein
MLEIRDDVRFIIDNEDRPESHRPRPLLPALPYQRHDHGVHREQIGVTHVTQ